MDIIQRNLFRLLRSGAFGTQEQIEPMSAFKWERLEITAHQTEEEEDTFLRADTLTNPVLNSQLQNILDDEHSDMTTRQVLLQLIRVVRHILNEGMISSANGSKSSV